MLSLADSIPKLVVKAHNYLGAKNVCVSCIDKKASSLLTLLSVERIAIARALLRNPKVLLLDEVSSITIVSLCMHWLWSLGNLCAWFQLRESRARGTGSGSPWENHHRHCAPTLYYSKCRLHVSRVAKPAFSTANQTGSTQLLHQGWQGCWTGIARPAAP